MFRLHLHNFWAPLRHSCFPEMSLVSRPDFDCPSFVILTLTTFLLSRLIFFLRSSTFNLLLYRLYSSWWIASSFYAVSFLWRERFVGLLKCAAFVSKWRTFSYIEMSLFSEYIVGASFHAYHCIAIFKLSILIPVRPNVLPVTLASWVVLRSRLWSHCGRLRHYAYSLILSNCH